MKSKTYDHESEVLLAVVYGEYRLAAQLIGTGYDANAREEDGGRTLLHWAVQEEHTPIVHLLLQRGADPEALDDDSFTPFSMAASQGNLRLIKIMRYYGARANGISPIHISLIGATAWNRSKCVRYLLLHGADVNAKDGSGTTALVLAVHHRRHGLASYLLRHGARASVRDEDGALLWELEQENRTPKTTRDLSQGGLTLWEMAEENNDAKMLRILNSA